MKKLFPVAYIVVGVLVGVLFSKYIHLQILDFSIENLVIVGILVCGFAIVASIVQSTFKTVRDASQPLGLPSGSVRAVLALTLVVMFIFIAVLFYLLSGRNAALAEKIITILGTLVIAISSFYFGTKATEQGSIIAQRVFQGTKDESNRSNLRVLPEVILKAIAANKTHWIEQFKCADIKLGKKNIGGKEFNVDCITFLVNSKATLPTDSLTRIPSIIHVTLDGNGYDIPTDVQVSEAAPHVVKKASLKDIEAFIIEKNRKTLLEKYKADAVQASLKITQSQSTGVPSLQFIVKDKFNLPKDAEKIPEYFEHHGLAIPTDVKEEDVPTEDATFICPGDSVRRKGTVTDGTIGMKVFRELNGKRKEYLLSCYHVFCNPELKAGQKSFTAGENAPQVTTTINSVAIDIGKVIEGEFSTVLDAALCEIDEGINAGSILKGYASTPKNGIKIMTTEDVENQTPVFTYGAVTKAASGIVTARETERTISIYGTNYFFSGIIPVTKISVPGDSGAMVADETGKVVGIIFASNTTTSFIIPISEIIIHFNIQISHG